MELSKSMHLHDEFVLRTYFLGMAFLFYIVNELTNYLPTPLRSTDGWWVFNEIGILGAIKVWKF